MDGLEDGDIQVNEWRVDSKPGHSVWIVIMVELLGCVCVCLCVCVYVCV